MNTVSFSALFALVVVCHATNGHFDEPNDILLKNIKSSALLIAKYVEKPDNKDSDLILKGARELDQQDCMLRTICNIVAQSDSNHSKLVDKIRHIFSRGFDNVTVHFKKETYSFPYKYAAYIGSTEAEEEERTCHLTFPVCEVKHETLMNLLNNLAQ